MIESFKDIHKGRRCFLLGSGPSIASMDLSALRNEITFSCNRGYLLFSQLGFPTNYWVLEDALDNEQCDFSVFSGPVKFVANDLPFKGEHVVTPFNRSCVEFKKEPPFGFGGTVMYLMLQLAAYMGCETAYLLGNDFKWDTTRVTEGDQWVTNESDDNHFDKNYWPSGFRSFPPQPDRMRASFFRSRGHGLRVVNVTPDSALDVFECDVYEDAVKIDTPKLYTQQHPSEIQSLVILLKKLQPHHVIEIGTLRGGTAATWHELNTGLVIGIDQTDNCWLTKRLPRFRTAWGSSHEGFTRAQVSLLLGDELADFLFIDGDHSYNGVRADWNDYKGMVRSGGVVVFHDINADPGFFESWEEGGVPRFWKELEGEKQEFSVNADWGGIGVIKI